jgi:hypothetical protein
LGANDDYVTQQLLKSLRAFVELGNDDEGPLRAEDLENLADVRL